MPPEFYGSVSAVHDPNSVFINFPASGSTAPTDGIGKPYGPDGPMTIYDDDTQTILYVGMRRAGRTIYSMDVSNVAAPELKWRVGCTDDGCSSGMDDMGQAWSPMSIAFADGTPVIIVGGGYDDCEDYDNGSDRNHLCYADPVTPDTDNLESKGDVVYVLNASNGAVLKAFDLPERAVVGRVIVVPEGDSDSNIAFAYAVDTGGNVYRISGSDANTKIGTTAPGDWTMTKIASFGCGPTSSTDCTKPRKFLFGPDVVRLGAEGEYSYQILVGSGDREKPITDYAASGGVQNYFFSFVDKPTVDDWLDDPNPSECGDDVFCLNSLVTVDENGPVTDGQVVGPKGWKFALGAGEQVVSAALTIDDFVVFSTHVPEIYEPGSCEPDLGDAYTYNLNFADGEGDIISIIGGGLVPSPVAGNVELDNGDTVPFCISCGGERSPIGGGVPGGTVTWQQAKNRVYWKIQK